MASAKHSFGCSDEERRPLNDYDDSEDITPVSRELHHGTARPVSLSNLCVIALVLVASLATAGLTILLVRPSTSNCFRVSPSSVSAPYAHQAPSFDHKLVVFNPDKQFLGPPTPVTEGSWQSFLPLGRGFVQVSDREGNPPTQYSVAAFHQYHCVHLLQRIFHRTVEDAQSITPEIQEHFYHCVDYIRQAIMCFADPSLDRVTEDPETPGRKQNSGWGDTHVCRDFDALRTWTEAHRATNATFPDSF